MNYWLTYHRADCYYIIETDHWHERFPASTYAFNWLRNHMGPGDTLHWADV